MIGHYKRSKFMAEQVVRDFAARGLDAVIVNPSTPVGPRDIKPTPTGRMVLEAATGKMPAFVDTGLNLVHVDDVAEGHVRAFDKGRAGERYILGGEDWSLREILNAIASLTGRKPPKICLPHAAIYPVAAVAQSLARLGFINEPFATLDGVRLARKKMYYSSAKAERELGYHHRPVRHALRDAIAYFGVPLAAEPVPVHVGI
jgi:dihydroflavonol-4-reductase